MNVLLEAFCVNFKKLCLLNLQDFTLCQLNADIAVIV